MLLSIHLAFCQPFIILAFPVEPLAPLCGSLNFVSKRGVVECVEFQQLVTVVQCRHCSETNRLDEGMIIELWSKGVLWDRLLGVHFMPR
ncbi:hypothetical protein ANCCEY_05238 [Ancylostoma ceylanicum]|uniref:Secreted protein n=1 Tax=Ancylostoma ceylanicum TaxID=53326 RepID=A0A0D6LWW1_9BILA|nr:hypothetical protein ANCCEY_05238 [Ancylostoma ceylanicum]